GGAVGDALGYAVEFISEEAIFRRYGKNGITEYDLTDGIAEISDDTQMTMFTATGLLSAAAHRTGSDRIDIYPDHIRLSYKDWYRTQTERFPLPEGVRHSWLVNVPELFSPRAPGNTCLSALEDSGKGSVQNPLNCSKGCGGVMRVAPVGLYFAGKKTSMRDSDEIGAEAAAITHGHDLGWLPAAALVHIVRHLIEHEGEPVLAAVRDAQAALRETFPHAKHLKGFVGLIQKAIDLAESETDDLDAIGEIGEGWVGDEALAIAVYCALKHPDSFEDAVVASVNHSGDSDSTGAITGNIMGAALGLKAIPEKYLRDLELREVIQELADDLYSDSPTEGESGDPVWLSKYVRADYRRSS
ncbi:MAG: ADP-ribosylglycohydrolase family protein, partial [Oscillospiraceae bacterium]|nr:ADP-ribosylglycohydrolase family protein [Oscillospiraceae bacterium]